MSFLINPFTFAVAGGDFESIATVTVGSGGAANIEFTSIGTDWQHLQVRLVARTDRAAVSDGYNITLNSDTGSNYAGHTLFGTGTSASAQAESSVSSASSIGAPLSSATASASIFGAAVIDVLDYASSSKKTTLRAFAGEDRNGAGRVFLISNLWNSTAAVTSIKIVPLLGSNFVQHSTAALYGVKAP
jgi:hypothetical protein